MDIRKYHVYASRDIQSLSDLPKLVIRDGQALRPMFAKHAQNDGMLV
jgi:hypothetical protein